jgi:hypothetical protein
MELLIGGWMFCGLIAAAIGARKGEGCTGFIVGAIFGPLGILFALLSSGNRVDCAFCREKVMKSALLCPHCKQPGPGAKAAMDKGEWPR